MGEPATGDLISTVAGVDLRHAGSAAYATGARAAPQLSVRTRPDPCFMDVYIDGALVYTKAMTEAPFDLNSIGLSHIAAIEVYTGPATMPAEFNRTSRECGVIAIWTR